MNKDLFEILKYEFFGESKNLDNDVDSVCKCLFTYVPKHFILSRWIFELPLNKMKFEMDFEDNEDILFMERLFCGITYVKSPDNLEIIKSFKENIEKSQSKRIDLNNKYNEDLSGKVFGKEYCNKKQALLELIPESKEQFNVLSERVYELNDLINQIKDLVLEDLSLYDDYLKFISNDKVKYILTLSEVCKYIESGKTKMFSDEEKLKGKSKLGV